MRSEGIHPVGEVSQGRQRRFVVDRGFVPDDQGNLIIDRRLASSSGSYVSIGEDSGASGAEMGCSY